MFKEPNNDLQRTLDAHNDWVNSGGVEGKRATLDGYGLHSINLAGLNLSSASLRNCDLNEANLSGTILNGANMVGTHIRNARCVGADFTNAKLSNADFNNSDLNEANFHGANLNQAKFHTASLGGSIFDNAVIHFAEFNKADLRGAIFRNVSFKNATFNNADLREVDLYGTKLDEASLTEADFSGARTSEDQREQIVKSGGILGPMSPTTFQVEKKLEETKEEKERLEKHLADKESQEVSEEELKKIKKQLNAAESKVDKLQNELSKARAANSVSNAAEKMRKAVEAARSTKRFNFWLSIGFMSSGVLSYLLALTLLGFIFFDESCQRTLGLITIFGESAVNNGWQIIPLYMPVVVLLTIGTALLRHEGKIREQSSLLLEQINHAEKAAGLLQTATDLEDIPEERLKSIILPTFVDIRRSLLDSNPKTQCGHEDECSLPPSQIKLIADILSKTVKSDSVK